MLHTFPAVATPNCPRYSLESHGLAMWLARVSASESTRGLITAKVATSPSVPAGLLSEAPSGASSHRRGASSFHQWGARKTQLSRRRGYVMSPTADLHGPA